MTLVTTLGPLRRASERGLVLPHEHVFCDPEPTRAPDYSLADEGEVSAVMALLLRQARERGVRAMVEPSTVGVGRRVNVLLTLSQTTGLPLGGADACVPRALDPTRSEAYGRWCSTRPVP
jgi:phosphotriesterase-related protein